MVPSRAALVALLLVVSLGAVPPPVATQESDPNGSDSMVVRQLSIPNESLGGPAWQVGLNESDTKRSNATRVGMDVGEYVAIGHDRTETRLVAETVRERYDSASTDDERFDLLSNVSDRVEDRLDTLESDERQAAMAYASGGISTETYLSRLVRIDREALVLLAMADWIENGGTEIESTRIIDRANEIRATATTFTLPIRDRVAQTIAGENEPTQVHLTAAENGFVVSAIVDDEFVRESRRFDQRATEGSTNDLRTSLDEIYATYPDAAVDLDSISVGGERSAGVFYATIDARSGVSIKAFIDNRNLLVFEEVYRQPVSTVSTNQRVQASDDGLALFVKRSYGGGPMQIKVNDRESGDPVDARLMVDERLVGSTGADGSVWVIDPGGPFTIAATTDAGATVSLSVQNDTS